jgi:CBS-domain-containing membrane protein
MDHQTSRDFLDRLEAFEREVLEVAEGLASSFRLNALLRRFPRRPVLAVFVLINGFIAVALLALLAMISNTSFVFPSVGPTAFLFFFTPTAPAASPRNALCGHAIGLACGYLSLWVVGLAQAPSAMVEGIHSRRVLAAALSLALTGALMILLRVIHPPAGATTLIVSLGIVTRPYQLIIVEAAVAVLAFQALILNRIAGVAYPVWSPAPSPPRLFGRSSPPPN